MGAEPVTAINGIGPRIAARLATLGIHTVAELAAADHHELARHFGPTIGPAPPRCSASAGAMPPSSTQPHVPRSRSREVTFPRDLVDPADVRAEVARLAEEVAGSVADLGRRITHVAVKVRTATFFTRSKIGKLPEPTTDPAVVVAKALEVLERFEAGRPIRLLGVRVVLEDPTEAPAP